LAFWQGDFGIGQVAASVTGDQSAGILLSLRLLLKATGFYVKKLFIPFPLNFAIVHVSELYIIVGVLFCALIILLLTRRTLYGFFFISAASLGASALLVPLIAITWTPLAERYMYIPSAFFLVGLTFAGYQWERQVRLQKIMVLVIAFVAAVAIVGTAQRNILWQDNLALLEDCLRKSPDFVPAQNQKANVLYSLGKTSEANAVIKSMKLPEDLTNFQYGLISKSAALVNEGDFDGAHKILRQALANPGRHEVKIIERLLKLNDREVLVGKAAHEKIYPENVQLLSRMYAITGDTFYLYRLGQTHLFNNDREKARLAFQRVVALAPEKVYYFKASQKLLTKLM
jgi:tetratricopeptide (TPR) repeat protein